MCLLFGSLCGEWASVHADTDNIHLLSLGTLVLGYNV